MPPKGMPKNTSPGSPGEASKKRGCTSLKDITLLNASNLERLIQEQRDTAQQKKDLTRQMKAARKKRSRVLKRVDLLTVDDLKAVIQERLEAEEQRHEGPRPASPASPAAVPEVMPAEAES